MYDLLRDEYDIQVELGDLGNVLAYLSIGDRPADIERLIGALQEIRRRFKKPAVNMFEQEYINPIVKMTPHRAFYAPKKSLVLEKCVGHICAEFVMIYPPGIPILSPGELVTQEIVEYIRYAKQKGCSMLGPEDMGVNRLNVID